MRYWQKILISGPQSLAPRRFLYAKRESYYQIFIPLFCWLILVTIFVSSKTHQKLGHQGI